MFKFLGAHFRKSDEPSATCSSTTETRSTSVAHPWGIQLPLQSVLCLGGKQGRISRRDCTCNGQARERLTNRDCHEIVTKTEEKGEEISAPVRLASAFNCTSDLGVQIRADEDGHKVRLFGANGKTAIGVATTEDV